MQTEELITVGDLAKRLKVPASWVYQRTRLGQEAIPHVKMGKYVRFNWDEVVTFLRKGSGRLRPQMSCLKVCC